MIIQKVSDALIEHCVNQNKLYNIAQRKTGNGTDENKITGMIGESVVSELLGYNWFDGSKGFDGGFDILFESKKIDVKTMGRTTEVRSNYTNNFLKLQDHFNPDIYFFCSYNKVKKDLTICGWITKKDFQIKRKYFPKGSRRIRDNGQILNFNEDTFEIDIKDLNQINNIKEFKEKFKIQYSMHKIKGKITNIGEVVTGVTKAGKEWNKSEFVIETLDPKYPKLICFTLMKQDQLQNHKVGGEVEVEFSVDSREFNGKWYHNINAVNLSKAFSDLPF
jgi:hypothetical protein